MEQDVAKEAHSNNEEKQNETLGSFLQESRKKKNLKIQSVSSHTRINITNLSALEADDVDRLPNIAYVRGFVKTLAKTYDIDEDKAIDLLEQLYGQSSSSHMKELEAEDFPQSQVEKKQEIKPKSKGFEFSDSFKYKVISLIGVCSIAIFVYVNVNKNKEVGSQELSKEIVLKAKPIETTVEIVKTNDKEEIVEKEVKQQSKTINEAVETVEKKEQTTADTTATEQEQKEEKEVEKEISFYNLPIPLFGFKEISEEERNKIIPENIRNSYEDDKQNVFLSSTSGDSWVVYKKDNDPIKAFTLKEGKYVFIKGERVLVRLGNINAMHVFYNNELLGMTSRSGVKSLVFPVEIAKEYKLPLFIFNKKNASFQTSKEYLSNKNQSEE